MIISISDTKSNSGRRNNGNNDELENEKEVNGNILWKKEDIRGCITPDFVHHPPMCVLKERDYFQQLFTDELLDYIVFQTNLFARQKDVNTKFAITKDELTQFFGILLYMGIVSLPAIEDYWNNHTRIAQVADVMSRDRFKKIRCTLHFCDNENAVGATDRFFKIRPLIDSIKLSARKVAETSVQSVDEVMIAYKGTRAGNLRQYIQNKPDKWGFKFFARASSDGFVHDLLPYQGAPTFESHDVVLNDQEKEMNLSSKVVISLVKSMKKPSGSIIYGDNYFTSYKLVKYLRDEYDCMYTGTARENRIANPGLRDSTEMNKKAVKRGEMDFKSSDGILALKWKDNKIVTMLSSGAGVEPLSTITRYDKESKARKEVPCPYVIQCYNSNMGGIDKSDMLGHLYKTPFRARRWYIPIVGYLLDLSVCNAWLLYKRDCVSLSVPPMPLKVFRLEIASSMTQCSVPIPRVLRLSSSSQRHESTSPKPCKVGQKSPPVPNSTRYDTSLPHMPVYSSRQTCKHYSSQNNLHRSRWMCETCNVALCLTEKNNCFTEYHKQ